MNPFRLFSSKKRKGSASSTDNKNQYTSTPATTPTPTLFNRSIPTRRPQAPITQSNTDLPPPPSYHESLNNANTNTNIRSTPLMAPAPATTTTTTTQADSPYVFLAQFDTIILVDDSGSMSGRNWRETSAALKTITPVCTQFDADGIDIFFLNHRNRRTNSGLAPGGYTNVNTANAVAEIFDTVRPLGGTPTGTRLNQILKPYLNQLEAQLRGGGGLPNAETSLKPLNIIVITDGVPSDDVESVIVSAARRLDNINAEPWQVGIQFFQVGEEFEAAADLKELDDALSSHHGVRDMVDTVPWTGERGRGLDADGILKVVLGSVNRRLDRRSA